MRTARDVIISIQRIIGLIFWFYILSFFDYNEKISGFWSGEAAEKVRWIGLLYIYNFCIRKSISL